MADLTEGQKLTVRGYVRMVQVTNIPPSANLVALALDLNVYSVKKYLDTLVVAGKAEKVIEQVPVRKPHTPGVRLHVKSPDTQRTLHCYRLLTSNGNPPKAKRKH